MALPSVGSDTITWDRIEEGKGGGAGWPKQPGNRIAVFGFVCCNPRSLQIYFTF
jgi:hypothetical protein